MNTEINTKELKRLLKELNDCLEHEVHWTDSYITNTYIAWNETASHKLGTFDTYEEAKQAIIKHNHVLDFRLKEV